MSVKLILYWVVALCIAAFVLATLLIRLQSKREQDEYFQASSLMNNKKSIRQITAVFLQHSYAYFLRIPVLKSYTLKVRQRLGAIPNHDEYTIRLRTSGAVYVLLLIFGASITVLFLMNPDPVYLLTLLISAAVMNGLVIDAYVNRLIRKMLVQTINLFTNVRHAYHRHGIVDEAVLEAAEIAGPDISGHAYKVHDVLVSPSPQHSLELLYETSPGRFIKSFAGISYLIMEYGDKLNAGGSIYLKALSGISREIQLELLRLSKLDYLLKGLNLIALAPIFFTKPIENWARSNFPLMDTFYTGKFGMLTKISIYVLILICYILLQKMKGEDEVQRGNATVAWESRWYELPFIRKWILLFLPSRKSGAYEQIAELLRDTHLRMRVEWFYLRRSLYMVGTFLLVLSVLLSVHGLARLHILNDPSPSQLLFGSMTKQERAEADLQTQIDKSVMQNLGMNQRAESADITKEVDEATSDANNDHDVLNREQREITIARIQEKLVRWHKEILHWWELLVAVLIAVVAYYGPYWLLLFQRRIRLLDMKHEIYQFYTLISIFRDMERISVDEILEWLHSFAVIFKYPLEKCILNFEHGPEEALAEMKEVVSLTEFHHLVDKLILAVGKISISKAFDDVESEMGYFFEQRKLDYEKTLDTKANMGRMIGFTPMYALIFMYLVIPLIWMSFNQMSVYYEQIQKL